MLRRIMLNQSRQRRWLEFAFTVNPILFEEMPNTPVATYFQSSATYTYKTYSTRYKTEKTLFSDKAKNVLDIVYYAFAHVSEVGGVTVLSPSTLTSLIEINPFTVLTNSLKSNSPEKTKSSLEYFNILITSSSFLFR